MNSQEIVAEAHRHIQVNLELRRRWYDAKTETERQNMLIEVAYSMGVDSGYEMGRDGHAF